MVQNAVTTHIDLAPTFFQLAGISARDDFDGTPIPISPSSKATRHEHVTVEYWGKGVAEGAFGGIGQ
jgi:arylsulfatase A-like enzyme